MPVTSSPRLPSAAPFAGRMTRHPVSSTCHSQLPQAFHSEGRLAYGFAARSLAADVVAVALFAGVAAVAGVMGEGAGVADVADAADAADVADAAALASGAGAARPTSGTDAVLSVSAASAFLEGTAGESETTMAMASSVRSAFFADTLRFKAVLHLAAEFAAMPDCVPGLDFAS